MDTLGENAKALTAMDSPDVLEGTLKHLQAMQVCMPRAAPTRLVQWAGGLAGLVATCETCEHEHSLTIPHRTAPHRTARRASPADPVRCHCDSVPGRRQRVSPAVRGSVSARNCNRNRNRNRSRSRSRSRSRGGGRGRRCGITAGCGAVREPVLESLRRGGGGARGCGGEAAGGGQGHAVGVEGVRDDSDDSGDSGVTVVR